MNPPSSHRFRHFLRRFTTSIAVVRQWCARGGFSFHIYTHNTAIVDSSLLFLCPFSFVSFFPFLLLLLLLPISINIPSQPASTHIGTLYTIRRVAYIELETQTQSFSQLQKLWWIYEPLSLSFSYFDSCITRVSGFHPVAFSKKKKRQELLIFIFFKFSYLTAVRLYSSPLYRWRNES